MANGRRDPSLIQVRFVGVTIRTRHVPSLSAQPRPVLSFRRVSKFLCAAAVSISYFDASFERENSRARIFSRARKLIISITRATNDRGKNGEKKTDREARRANVGKYLNNAS